MSDSRYPALTWPWVGVILCLALLGQEYMLQAAGPNAPLTLYRIVLMSVGISSVALVLLPPRRIAYFLAFFVCAILILYALYLQYIEGLEPCPLCVFQRICLSIEFNRSFHGIRNRSEFFCSGQRESPRD